MDMKTVRVTGVARYEIEFDEEIRVPASLSDKDAKHWVSLKMAREDCNVKLGWVNGVIADCDDSELNFDVTY